jgi:hypothetical protein
MENEGCRVMLACGLLTARLLPAQCCLQCDPKPTALTQCVACCGGCQLSYSRKTFTQCQPNTVGMLTGLTSAGATAASLAECLLTYGCIFATPSPSPHISSACQEARCRQPPLALLALPRGVYRQDLTMAPSLHKLNPSPSDARYYCAHSHAPVHPQGTHT